MLSSAPFHLLESETEYKLPQKFNLDITTAEADGVRALKNP